MVEAISSICYASQVWPPRWQHCRAACEGRPCLAASDPLLCCIRLVQRMSDIPELSNLRALFTSKYGKELVNEASSDVSCVKWQVREGCLPLGHLPTHKAPRLGVPLWACR